jgi:hypothetical protein
VARLGLAAERPNSDRAAAPSTIGASASERARLPYISDAKRERARWMTLAEMIAYVMKHDDCDHSSATEQLCDAICDGKIRSKWEDRKWFDSPARFWARIRISDAKVADPGTGEWRTLLVLKDDVFRIWPEPSVASAASERGQETEHRSNVVPTAKAKVGAYSAQNEIEQTYHQLVQQNPSIKTKAHTEVAKLIAKKCGKNLEGERGWSTRRLLEHIQHIRAKH